MYFMFKRCGVDRLHLNGFQCVWLIIKGQRRGASRSTSGQGTKGQGAGRGEAQSSGDEVLQCVGRAIGEIRSGLCRVESQESAGSESASRRGMHGRSKKNEGAC